MALTTPGIGRRPALGAIVEHRGRAVELAAGVALLAVGIAVSGNPTVLALAAVAVILMARGLAGVGRPAPPHVCGCQHPTDDDLFVIELALLDHRAWVADRANDIGARVDRITDIVAELADQER